jgi:hypothetical protein
MSSRSGRLVERRFSNTKMMFVSVSNLSDLKLTHGRQKPNGSGILRENTLWIASRFRVVHDGIVFEQYHVGIGAAPRRVLQNKNRL